MREKKRVSIRVEGKVQGVFYRASAQEKARSLGVGGLVQNEADGSVYIEAEGDAETLETFIKWCQRGPSTARVDRCEIQEEEPVGYSNFIVRQ